MLLEDAAKWLGWPAADQILDPDGEGAKACLRLAKLKIGGALQRRHNVTVETGILIPDPKGDSTAAPLAVVCQFSTSVNDEVLDEAHRLAWNFSRSAVLVTLEPNRILAWSCLQDPNQSKSMRRVCELSEEGDAASNSDQERIRELLHWVSLATGHLQKQLPDHFPGEGRADALLLKNLRFVRNELIGQGLPRSFCHDLLARVIFTQFLFHRKDSGGKPFFSETMLKKKCDGQLKNVYSDLPSILRDKTDTYALFRWMDTRFNGDLFPGNWEQTHEEREAAWQAEEDAVEAPHLELLADLASGEIDTEDRQLLLWPQYSFDTIPLEFISSVYEEFLNEDRDPNRAYYTPPQLVDYVLDAVLPWGGTEWDIRVLDPACGSGIFLVKAFQRLIHRWRQAHGRDPRVRDLKPILAGNLHGVDINPDAVRVACFSLYLAMADAIEPKHYVTREKVFPPLRGIRLLSTDFFAEDVENLLTGDGQSPFDLVIGNAPWGDKSAKETSEEITVEIPAIGRRKAKTLDLTKAENWARIHEWPITNNDIGPLFVTRGLSVLASDGRLAMLQPAPPWLYQRGKPALKLRQKFFQTYSVDEITNLSALRREVFTDVIGPSCVIVASSDEPKPDLDLYYFTPKPIRSADGIPRFAIEPQDVNRVSHYEAATDPLVWPVLSLGGRRDLQLIRRLSKLPTLAKLKRDGKVQTRLGVIPGKKKQKPLSELRGLPYFEDTNFPDDVFLELDAARVDPWDDPRVASSDSTDFSAFHNPQLLIKQSFVSSIERFRAALVKSDDLEWGVICKKTYLSVCDLDLTAEHINAACVTYNSFFAPYFLFLTSSRLGHYITEVNSNELMALPLPTLRKPASSFSSPEEIDKAVRKALSLTGADNALIEDVLRIRLPDALRQTPGPARTQTRRVAKSKAEPELTDFADTFLRVIRGTFGGDKPIAATILQEASTSSFLPIRAVTFHIGDNRELPIQVETIEADGLLDQLGEFHRDVLSKKARTATNNGLGFQRVAFLFHKEKGKPGQNLTVIKPDEYRYWTRSQAMQDADELSNAILRAAKGR